MKDGMKSKVQTGKSATFAKGGSGKMAGKSGAAPSESGKVTVGGRKGNNKFSPDRGGKKMAGFSPASAAKAR
jgi:hypothetical protein